jgi:hypothetical protein
MRRVAPVDAGVVEALAFGVGLAVGSWVGGAMRYVRGDSRGSCPDKHRLEVNVGKGGGKLRVCPCAFHMTQIRELYKGYVSWADKQDGPWMREQRRWADTTML